jgi:hypothetical protein
MFGAEDSAADGQQGGGQVAGGSWVSGLPGPAGKVMPGVKRVGVLAAEDLLRKGQQCGELVAGRSRVTRVPGEAGEVGASA